MDTEYSSEYSLVLVARSLVFMRAPDGFSALQVLLSFTVVCQRRVLLLSNSKASHIIFTCVLLLFLRGGRIDGHGGFGSRSATSWPSANIPEL